jgi:anti-sigma-K factor RskA
MQDLEHTGDMPPEDLAAEYVLGVLDATAWAQAAGRAQHDPDFADQVEAWETRLTPMFAAIDSQLPSRDLWPDIQRRLPANAGAATQGSLALWRGLTAAAGFVAAACLVLVVMDGKPPATRTVAPTPAPVAEAPEPLQMALLKPEKGPTTFVATLDRSRRVMTVAPGAAAARKGRDLELGMIAPGGKPQALGVIPVDHPARMPMPDAFAGKGETKIILAVSVEPVGGSPTGQPTGPVIATGVFSAV